MFSLRVVLYTGKRGACGGLSLQSTRLFASHSCIDLLLLYGCVCVSCKLGLGWGLERAREPKPSTTGTGCSFPPGINDSGCSSASRLEPLNRDRPEPERT